MLRVSKAATLAVIGGCIYAEVEILWRGYTHWTMILLGGLMFLLIGCINEWMSWRMPLLLQGVIGAAIITAAELAAGSILNIWHHLGIWDYSQVPFNLWGQICLPFSLLWVVLSVFSVVLDDWLRWLLWGEERPHYTIWRWGHE